MRQVKTRAMEIGANSGPEAAREASLAEGFAAAMDWWREAGVDCAFVDNPVDWLAAAARPDPAQASPGETPLARPAKPRAVTPPAPPPPPALVPPDVFAAFAPWWLGEPALDGGRTSGRVPPRGPAGARLMVVVPEPEREDRETLLSGPQGAFLSAMLGAMELGESAVYFASALPRHTPMADWAALADIGIGAVLARHIALVAPERLIVFGGNILPLLGNAPAQGAAVLREFNHEGGTIPLLAARELPALLNTPRGNARLWQAWLDWTAPGADGRASGASETGTGTT